MTLGVLLCVNEEDANDYKRLNGNNKRNNKPL